MVSALLMYTGTTTPRPICLDSDSEHCWHLDFDTWRDSQLFQGFSLFLSLHPCILTCEVIYLNNRVVSVLTASPSVLLHLLKAFYMYPLQIKHIYII